MSVSIHDALDVLYLGGALMALGGAVVAGSYLVKSGLEEAQQAANRRQQAKEALERIPQKYIEDVKEWFVDRN